jgi:serine/threonine-protein kinase
MAQVWRGTDEVLRRAVAVKILHSHLTADETFVTRFRHEAIAVARLSHPAIVNVYDTCNDNGTEAIVMELVRGNTLRDQLDEGLIEPWVAANIAAQVAGALDVAHAAGLVHRDIKPANILLSEDGRVKVGDFGIAKAAESADLTQEGSFVGTAKYLAPEQVESKPVDGRTDLYSLGIVLYEMLCGRVPFEGDSSSATALARLHQDPQPPRYVQAGVPRGLEAICMRLLARSPDGRYPTAADVRAALLSAGAEDRAVEPDATIAGGSTAGMVPPPPPAGYGVPTPHGSVPADVGGAGMASGGALPSGGANRGMIPSGGAVPPPRFAETERRWLVPTLLVILVAVALGVAGVLLGRGVGGDDDDGGGDPDVSTTDTSLPGADPGVAISEVIAYDPQGDDQVENDDQAPLAIDDDPSTGWKTTKYYGPRLGELKDGVGLIVVLDGEQEIGSVVVESPVEGWSAQIFLANEQPQFQNGWGAAVAEVEGATAGETTFEFDPDEKGAVLVWITDQGDGVDGAGEQMQINEVRVLP